ncbi:MAG: SagB/ThcOx family dehydrogenase, partial [Chloroflexi bacterium]|nr:SagB/ThcOx family dehydrogenase [Chloroflexota bacterium]
MLDPEIQKKLIEEGRDFLKSYASTPYDDFESDQRLNLPQPPLVKAPMTERAFALPGNFENLWMKD